ncbi:class I SAM-dependent methyltransferase family protein [Candidatus Micrarchaeota archaeon]|nr:class I SAM-dependent methyltransferase family protein [Candidatus Micrarchaeota archaeon]
MNSKTVMQHEKKTSIGIAVPAEKAQALHSWLLKKSLLDSRLKPIRKKTRVVFPIITVFGDSEKKELKKLFPAVKKEKYFFEAQPSKSRSLKQALEGLLTKSEKEKLVSGFDTLGNIAIIEIPRELEKKEKKIGAAVLETNANIQTVCKKTGAHKGKYRIEPVKIIAGKKSLTADYRERGCRFRIQVGKTFFSPRLSHERSRIAEKIKKGEIIGAFFAGVGPFPIVFAKNSSMKKSIAIELNPIAVKDLKYNIKQNNVDEKIVAVLGDVKKIVPKRFKGFFDRVVMPLPKDGEDFLKEAMVSLKPSGGIIHFYAFVPSENSFHAIIKRIRRIAQQNGFTIKILEKKQVRSFSKDLIQIVIDFWAKKEK